MVNVLISVAIVMLVMEDSFVSLIQRAADHKCVVIMVVVRVSHVFVMNSMFGNSVMGVYQVLSKLATSASTITVLLTD